MLNVGDGAISELFLGDMGMKEAIVGTETVYTRDGGYFYLEFNTNENTKE